MNNITFLPSISVICLSLCEDTSILSGINALHLREKKKASPYVTSVNTSLRPPVLDPFTILFLVTIVQNMNKFPVIVNGLEDQIVYSLIFIGGSSDLPMWLTGCFWVTFFGRWWGLCAYT